MKIILTGATGLIGSRFEQLLFETHEIIPLSSKSVDITDSDAVNRFFDGKDADVVIHLSGKTNVDDCELDKIEDLRKLGISEGQIMDIDPSTLDLTIWKNNRSSFASNTVGTLNLYKTAKDHSIKFVYISSDFVFSGNGEYKEDDDPSPINWYGMTKYLGEKVVTDPKDIIARISFPYGYLSPVKKDFVWKLHDLLTTNDEVSLVSDQTITPTFIDDIVWGLIKILEKKESGIFHMTGSSSHTPLEIGTKIKEKFGLSTKILETTLNTLYKGKAPRPFKSIPKNARLVQLGFTPKTLDEGLGLLTAL